MKEYTFEITLKIKVETSPALKMLAFFIEDKEIIPDSLNFKINKCLKNQVNLTVKENKVSVKKLTTINIKTTPFSICALSALDKSVTFMGKRNAINLNRVCKEKNYLNLICFN